VLAIIPLALMVLTATGYFYTTLRLSGRWIETVYLVISGTCCTRPCCAA
jgi:potassium efflux system protein